MKRNMWTSIGGLHPMKAGMEDWKLPLTNMEVRGGGPRARLQSGVCDRISSGYPS